MTASEAWERIKSQKVKLPFSDELDDLEWALRNECKLIEELVKKEEAK